MPKRSSKKPTEPDVNETAARVIGHIVAKHDIPEAAHEKNPAAVELGRRGGLKGGKSRAARLTPERRSQIARDAAKKRWKRADED